MDNSLKNNSTKLPKVAILPFSCEEEHEKAKFYGEGIAEEILSLLSNQNALRVISRRSSFKLDSSELSTQQIGEKLGAEHLIEGKIKWEKNHCRVLVYLIDSENDTVIWSDGFESSTNKLHDLHSEIGMQLSKQLNLGLGNLTNANDSMHSHLQSKAYELSLMGLYYFRKWNAKDVQLAIGFFNQSLKIDPNNPITLLRLADCLGFLATTGVKPEAWTEAGTTIRKAISLHPNLSEGHYQLANLAFFVESDYEQSLAEAKKAVALNPNFAEAQQFLSFLYALAGKTRYATNHLSLANEVDPLSPETLFFKAYHLYMLEKFDEALKALDICLKDNPHNIPAFTIKCYCLLLSNKPESALKMLETLPKDVLVRGDELGIKCIAYHLMKQEKKQDDIFEQLIVEAESPLGFRADSFKFMHFAISEQYDKAFEWIEKNIEYGSPLLMIHFADPMSKNLRKDPRFDQAKNRLFPPHLFSKKIQSKLSEHKISNAKDRLNLLMSNEKPYLDAQINLNELANKLNINSHELSALINNEFDKNFNEFINDHRLEEFKKVSLKSEFSHLSLSGIAYECGFNSKTTFNTYFKKKMGMTPKEYINSKK
ncbi:helix-turn-helix domain-containing protein [Aureibacter tunicatorum]|uniref:TolB-like protein/AraC-like DNA-binding protein/cytochrome c-type biogenesis protein CcmH/NrfG n=1 Tax=Aureibacter tunicatorum TaxID=866807 RepID=A0AAE3XMK4_9BACT|nr:helix-turn-helix domain-containing protein [Aureibacter tunicatorum]MDR6240681.1 TolB-like protein/AraC-like DNA-binding protein/cytochrome c-type biogenesis protein CcmH/NrfG [Aureibacter tunicatorum]BDD06986.1 hypothetical protein AUTU_44690 [Aureibacter tunicatorum]